ncbi:hypothetical protein [Marimonas arenosa]|uniref:Uncharacterized protein n=1 Tax=Marimonas arenosa TaxID=1795305 RepID=A0AAE4B1U4_9RHOB|nr:hypothetical protein [Marimonas arenosa]MDQ2088413.1 hypothetical protein [Marimonas arenosa]
MPARLPPGWLPVALLALACTALSGLFPGMPFAAYYGPLPALAGTAFAALLAGFGLASLHRDDWIAARPTRGRARLLIPAVGLAFALPTVTVDIIAPWPPTINVTLPQGLLFYISIALTAEAVFHVVPLALLLGLASRLRPRLRLFWPAAAIAACAEPAFQIALGRDPATPLWRDLFLGLNLAGFALAQFALLRRYGLLGAYGARLGYYALWHITWGSARLPLLFAPE